MQKYVEALDVMKAKNLMPASNGAELPLQSNRRHVQQQGRRSLIDSPKAEQASRHSAEVVITTQWETFDSVPSSSTTAKSVIRPPAQPSFTWDLL